ncbi:MAG: glycosyltransferase family 2 protein [Actinomycetota bacterium]|nr:glycosyltransferase family 2 protein [Actinomycetota bacterium]
MPADPPPLDALAAYLSRRCGEEGLGHPLILDADAIGRAQPSEPSPPIVLVRDPVGGLDDAALATLAEQTGTSPRFRAPGFGLLDRFDPLGVSEPPASFRVLAIVTTFNEADIVGPLLDRLLEDGIFVHAIDNWSSDGTLEQIEARARTGRLSLERFPSDGPSPYFELRALLARVQEYAHHSGADWVIHHDADEIRQSPWPGVSLRHALFAVDRFGFNCIDHTVLNFMPVDNDFVEGGDLERHFRFFEFGDVASHFLEQKAWKPQRELVEIASTGGHEAAFSGRRVFPYKFLLRHYPIRSQQHGERKIFRERQGRFHPGERARGWHIHYDLEVPGTSFLRDPASLFSADDLDGPLLAQRLSGAGLPGNPRRAEGPAQPSGRSPFAWHSATVREPASVRIQLALGALAPGHLARALRSIGAAIEAHRGAHPGVAVDLAIGDRSSAPVMAAHQLEALAASLVGRGLRALSFAHFPRQVSDEELHRGLLGSGPAADYVLVCDGASYLDRALLGALVGAARADVGVVFARQLPLETTVRAEEGESWPAPAPGEALRVCALVRHQLLSAAAPSEPEDRPALVRLAHHHGLRAITAAEGAYVRDEPLVLPGGG